MAHRLPNCTRSAGPPLLDYFAATFPELRRPAAAEGLADFVVDVTTRADTDPKQACRFADAYAASQLHADNEAAQEALRGEALAALQQPGGGGGGGGGGGVRGCGASCSGCGGQEEGTVTPMWFALLVLYRYRTLRAIKVLPGS